MSKVQKKIGGTPTKLLTLYFLCYYFLFLTAQNPCNTGIMYYIHNKNKET